MESVLLIDDDFAIRQLVSDFLIEAGYDVKEAQDGEDGIEMLKKNPTLKAVITDIRMPKKNGNEVARYLRDSLKRKDIPIVAITGYIDEAEKDLFTHLFEKPFKMKDLVELINSF